MFETMERSEDEPSAVFQPRALESNPSCDPSVTSSTVSFKRSGSRFMTEAEEGEILSQATAQAMTAARSIIMSGGTQSTALSTAKAAAKSVLMPKRGRGAKPPFVPQQKGFFGRKKGKQQAEIIASMALVSVNSSVGQQGFVGQNQSIMYNPSGMLLPRTENSVLSGITMEEDPIIRRTRAHYQDSVSPANSATTLTKLMNESSVGGADHIRTPSRASVQVPTPTMDHAQPPSWSSVRSSTATALKADLSSPSPKKGVASQEGSVPVHAQKLESVHAPVPTSEPSPLTPLAGLAGLAGDPSPPKVHPTSPTLSTIFRKTGIISKKKKEAIVAAVVKSTMDGHEECDGKGNSVFKKEGQGSPTEPPKISRIPSEMPVPRSQAENSNSLKADAKSKKSAASSKKNGNSRTMTDDEHRFSYSSSFSGTEDESRPSVLRSYSIDAYETHSHEYNETSDDESLSTNGGDNKDLSGEDKSSTWIDPFFASITAALSCSPAKKTQNDEHGDGYTTDEEEYGYKEAAFFFPENRDDEEVRQANEMSLSLDSSLQLNDGEPEEERQVPAAEEGKPFRETKKHTREEKSVSMEQLVLRALAATVSPSSNRPKLDLKKAPPPKSAIMRKLPSRPTSRSPSKLHSTHAMVKTMSKNRETGLYSPPSVDHLQSPNEQTPGLAEDAPPGPAEVASHSQSFLIGSGESEVATGNGKKSAMIPGWFRRKGGKNKGSF